MKHKLEKFHTEVDPGAVVGEYEGWSLCAAHCPPYGVHFPRSVPSPILYPLLSSRSSLRRRIWIHQRRRLWWLLEWRGNYTELEVVVRRKERRGVLRKRRRRWEPAPAEILPLLSMMMIVEPWEQVVRYLCLTVFCCRFCSSIMAESATSFASIIPRV